MKERDQTLRARRPARAIRKRLTYANTMATFAVFVALGGSAWAIQANSVGPRELKNNAVRAKHIKKNQVRAKHVANKTVRTPKIRNGAVNNAKLHSDLRARWARFGGSSSQPAFQGRGVLDVTRLSAGRYDVTFNRDPSDCAMFASLSPFTLDGRFIGVSLSDTGGPNDVRVQTRNGNGDLADVGGIQVLLVC